ncbi:MAG TPA: hypothetical protein VF992_04095 [Thermoplasmata archaeon]
MLDGVSFADWFEGEETSPDIDLPHERLDLLTESFSLHFDPGFPHDSVSSVTLAVLLAFPSPLVDAFVATPFCPLAELKPETFFPAGKASLSEVGAGKAGLSGFDEAASRAYVAERGFIGQAPRARLIAEPSYEIPQGTAEFFERAELGRLATKFRFADQTGRIVSFPERTVLHFYEDVGTKAPFSRFTQITQKLRLQSEEEVFGAIGHTIRTSTPIPQGGNWLYQSGALRVVVRYETGDGWIVWTAY